MHSAVWRDGKLVGFVDWDTAGDSSREVDLAFVALSYRTGLGGARTVAGRSPERRRVQSCSDGAIR